MSSVLSGRRILLTRPEGQVEPLAARLREQGAAISHFPAIRITLTPPDSTAQAMVEQATYVIFASTNAVRGLMAGSDSLVDAVRHATGVAAIGPATEKVLSQAGLEPDVVAPPPYNSEALLSTPMLQDLEHRHVVIVRGQSGREMLAEELERRGAKVHYLEVYRREPPTDTLSLGEIPDGPPEAICVTSVEIAENLLRCVASEEKAELQRSAFIVGNTRIADACRKLGYTAPAGVADNPGDDAMFEALRTYFSSQETVS